LIGPVPLARPLPRVVVGERVTLEVWHPHRVTEIRELVEGSRDELADFLAWAIEPLSAEDEERLHANFEIGWRAGLMVGWAVIEDGVARGTLGLHRRSGPHELEIGYWLATGSTGRGLMTEAAAMATDVAFSTDGVEVVEIIHDVANHRSEGVPRRLGYRRVAAFSKDPAPGALVARKETGVRVRWSVDRDEWRSRERPSSVLTVEV
jgi:RimJ/RimL family protein N-acetyltransferase